MLYAILGIIQGLTEFLPVSSSGHLVLFSQIFDIDKTQVLPIIIICHIGTLCALLCFFARDILRIAKDIVFLSHIFVVSLITALFVLISRNLIKQLFQKPSLVCSALLITAVFLILTQRITRHRRGLYALNIMDAFWLGLSQAFAVIPGISRSGLTIFSLLVRGVEPEIAFRFSFIAGIPAILGSFILELKDIELVFNNSPIHSWAALCMSYIFGLIGLFILRRIVKNLQLHYFGYYLIIMGILGFIFIK